MHPNVTSDVRNSRGRLAVVVISVLLQLGWIILLFVRFSEYSLVINSLIGVAAFVLVLHICGRYELSAFKLSWVILILIFPLLGVCLYGLFGNGLALLPMRKRFERLDPQLMAHLPQMDAAMEQLTSQNRVQANECGYIRRYSGYPVYRGTGVQFYPEATDGFEAQLKELARAKSFIFMEYHAIEEAQSFRRLKDVLADRAAHGVEVRILYDDIGSVGFIDPGFIKRMEAVGVKCRVFNPLKPVLNLFMNNRDHRKITVIDGRVGFTGGYNLADEYFNITHPYGIWKDTGLCLEGSAVRSLTVQFLEMWNVIAEEDTDYLRYLPELPAAEDDGYVQPYADSPIDDEPVGENVYLNLIKSAQKRLWAATPYLIISDEMTRELCMAAQRGVDVRVITPGIPDKKLIYRITRSYYAGLARRGVRIYEYTPGFLHEKQMLADDASAVVGTINLDYRSLYHHFENGVLMHGCGCLRDIEQDFEQTMSVSREVTAEYADKSRAPLRISQCIWRLIAPLL